MDENRYAVGIDLGTKSAKVVIASIHSGEESGSSGLTIVGVGERLTTGMRKGAVVDITRVSEALDGALSDAERMSGQRVENATVAINGSHIAGVNSRGVVAVNGSHQIIGSEEVDRVIDAATIVKLAPNRKILDVKPRSFTVDNQEGVRDPIEMTGVRLEVDAYVITALTPHIKNVDQVIEKNTITNHGEYVPACLASSRLALSEQQKENGAVAIDIGYATTSMVVYEEGDIIDIKVLPVGSNNITTDLAIGLKTDLDIAEQVKLQHAVAAPELRRGKDEILSVKIGDRKLNFDTATVDEIVEARLGELFDMINKELRQIKKQANLPGGAVITGGGAKLRGMADYAKAVLSMNTSIFTPKSYKGVTDQVNDSAWTTALGLVELDAEFNGSNIDPSRKSSGGFMAWVASLFNRKK